MDEETKRELSTAADMAGLQMEFLELLRDAERYRWLRRNPAWMGWTRDHQPEHVDAAVDNDMAA